MDEQPGFLMDELTWAQRVKSVRLKLNITQEAFAELLGVHFNTVPLWETRTSRPFSEAAEKFMQFEAELAEEENGGVS